MVSASAGDHDPSFSLAKVKAVFAKMMPSIKRHARIAFRHLDPEAKQEAVQNVLCNTWEALVRLARRGKLDKAFPTVLANFAEKQTRDHRIVGGHLSVKEVLSAYAQRLKGFKVERLDKYDRVNECWYDPEECCHEILAESRNVTPASLAASRIDFSAWMQSLPVRHRRIAQFLSLGHRTSDASRKFKVSQGRISQLRKELAENCASSWATSPMVRWLRSHWLGWVGRRAICPSHDGWVGSAHIYMGRPSDPSNTVILIHENFPYLSDPFRLRVVQGPSPSSLFHNDC